MDDSKTLLTQSNLFHFFPEDEEKRNVEKSDEEEKKSDGDSCVADQQAFEDGIAAIEELSILVMISFQFFSSYIVDPSMFHMIHFSSSCFSIFLKISRNYMSKGLLDVSY